MNAVYAVGSTVYAATNGGLSISTDGGVTFINRTTADGLGTNGLNPLNGQSAGIVVGVYAVGSTVYAATSGGLSVSTDDGATFATYTSTNGVGFAGPPAPNNSVYAVYAVGTTVYAGTVGSGLSISG